MSKKSSFKQPVTRREALPLVEKDGKQNILKCPFCNPTHPISPFVPSTCGTVVEVKAVQVVYHAKYDRNFVCAKCGKGGGDMVKWQDAFIHTHDCAPGSITLAAPPEFSKLAKYVYGLPKDSFVKYLFEKAYGKAVTVDEVTPSGVRTGVILGHFFYRGTNGKHPTIST